MNPLEQAMVVIDEQRRMLHSRDKWIIKAKSILQAAHDADLIYVRDKDFLKGPRIDQPTPNPSPARPVVSTGRTTQPNHEYPCSCGFC